MSKTVSELFEGLDVTVLGDAGDVVAGLAYRSDEVQPNDAFFCIVGLKADGHTFAQDAIDRGAKVIVAERKLYLADATDVTEVIVSDTRKAMAHAASAFFDHPSRAFALAGVTGTNGKTTTTYLLEHILRAAGKRTGVIGTVGVMIDGAVHPTERTTPESPDLQRIFARMRDDGMEAVAMEVSSHALDLMRTWGSSFSVTAFTNLSQDHLDYHHTFEAYFEAKARLFSKEYPARRVICIDDKWGRELLRRCSVAEEYVITTGFSPQAQIHPVEIALGSKSTHVVLDVRGESIELSYPLVGKFNVSNVMTAFAMALALGVPVPAIAEGLADAPQVPGRLERVGGADALAPAVYVDYAHTPDALKKAIASIRAITPGKTGVVFGCGGDRDSSKRSIMGSVALDADWAVVTSDNPRTEDPDAIIANIVSGMAEGSGRYEVEPDRSRAIERAIARAGAGDSVLIAGKGHEDYQIVGRTSYPFDDRVHAARALAHAFGADAANAHSVRNGSEAEGERPEPRGTGACGDAGAHGEGGLV